GHVHDLADLLGVGFGKRAAKNGEVLAENVDLAAVDGAPTGDDAIAWDLLLGHAEIRRAVRDEHVEFFERAFVKQHFDALARRQLALGVLGVDAAGTTAKARLGTPLLQLLEDRTHYLSSRLVRTLLPPTKSKGRIVL